ncbi:MAG: serine/threonine protein kinase [Planctomycetes bacterium]|nr:serine/threonine protein kinase [Planctomycetota bacterium]
MATIEPTPTVRANFAATQSPNRQNAVGRIGPWQLVRMLNESDLARVYLARPADAAGDQPPTYVLKVLRREWWRDPQAIEMQRRAAWLGRKVSHPHLLPVLSANVGQAPFYFVTPHLPGSSLATILEQAKSEQKQRLPLPVTLWIVRQVAEALAALHESAHMIHADVKPSNIIVSSDGHATLIDLGFAHTPTESQHWSSRPVVGTLSYIAPEVVTSSLAAEVSSDLYSLGVTLYEMITGSLPFVASAPDLLIRLHRESKPECVRHAVPQLPKPVASLVHRLLAKDPLRRPPSAMAIVEELMRLEIECFSQRAG